MTDIFARPQLDRRTLLRRAGAVGLLATPAVSMLAACAGGGGSTSTPTQATGTVSADNPLGINPSTGIEIVIFDGGLGTKYATDVDTPLYNKKWPNSKVTYSATQQISTTLKPRMNSGNPPDMIDNSGSDLMDFGAIVNAGQAADLTDLFAAASLDIPGKKVSETLVPGAIEVGSYAGKPYAVNYSFTVYGLWYNQTLWTQKGWTPPSTWADFTALCDKIKAAGVTPFGFAGANASYYMVRAVMTSAAKIGTEQVLKDIDNLKAGAWQNPAVLQAATAWGQIGVKYIDKSFLGLRHTNVQLEQDQNKLALYPCGSWLENEMSADTPSGYQYAVMPIPSVTTSDQLPATAINAAAGEIYFTPAKAKNIQGGKEYLRTMLSKEAALGFTKLTKSLTVVAGAADGVTISPGLSSASDMLSKAGSNVFIGYLFDTWYKALDTASRDAANELMFKGGDAKKFCDTMEAASQQVAKDSTITKFTRS